jgi:hypothetical protein
MFPECVKFKASTSVEFSVHKLIYYSKQEGNSDAFSIGPMTSACDPDTITMR